MSAERKQWFGRRAIEWVLDEAPHVPPNLVSTLIGLARHAQDDGTGAGPGVETLMGYTNKSRRQVKYDLDKLRELKIIKVSDDQSRVAHIRADRRPVVYDIAMTAACNPLHPEEAERRATDCTPQDAAPAPRGATHGRTGCNTASDEVQPIAPEENYEKNKEKNNPSLSARTSVPAPRDPADERERDESTSPEDPNLTWHQRLVIEANCPPHLAAAVSDRLQDRYPDRGPGWWRKVKDVGDLAELVRETIEALTSDPHCGTCGGTGKTTTHDQWDQPIPADCPACTPLTNDRIKAFVAQIKGHPLCPDGEEGGNLPMPGTGWMACAICRRKSGYVPVKERNEQARTSDRQNANSRNAQDWLNLDVTPTASSPRRIGSRHEPPPAGYTRSPDGRLVLTDTRAFNYDDWIGRPPSEAIS